MERWSRTTLMHLSSELHQRLEACGALPLRLGLRHHRISGYYASVAQRMKERPK